MLFSKTSKVSFPKCSTILLAVFGPNPFINPEPKYFSSGAINTATPLINVKIPLGMFYDTFLEIDKTVLFKEITTLPNNF